MSVDPNKFWEGINQDQLSLERIEEDFSRFKSSAINYKIALYNPSVNGIRYLKTLINFMASGLDDEQWELINKVPNREVGEPIAVDFEKGEVCLDYLQALDEFQCMTTSLSLSGFKVLEIGAGYGRTAHFLLSNAAIAEYYILDLENALQLGKKYLQRTLPSEHFEKLRFIPIEDFSSIQSLSFDLAINIDSFAEMDKDVVHEYLIYIDQQCRNFYVKNPVAKYLDKTLDGHSQGNEVLQQALAQGILTDIIDIDNRAAVETESRKFLDAYKPSAGWTIANDAWAPPFSHVWQAVYQKK